MKITRALPKSFDLHSDQINVRDINVAPFEKTRVHNHHERECWSVVSGEGVVSSGHEQLNIRSGDHIEFMPFDVHTVENRGTENLRFTTRWYADWSDIVNTVESSSLFGRHVMIEAAFPTPNGPLHLGHLSGAYLMSDVLKRCFELTGTDSFSYCGTYGHTNHIDRTATVRGTTYAALVARSEDIIRTDLERFQAGYDAFLSHIPLSASFDATKSKFIDLLLASPHLVERTVEHPYSESSGQFVCESYVTGRCPHCGSVTIGMECEACGLYQDECSLIDPSHSVTKEKLVLRQVKRLYLKVDRDILSKIAVQMYSNNTAASRICYDRLVRYLDEGMLTDIPVSSLRGNGVLVKGDQALTVVMERALRSYYGLSQYPSTTHHLFFCGIDNLCGSGILMPYVLKILGVPDAQLPIAVINHFCLLENRKFSTGANHAIWANDFLQKYPSDLLRLYLSYIHSTTNGSNFRIEAFFDFSNRVVDTLIKVFTDGNELAALYTNDRIEAGPWLSEDITFYRELNDSMRYCLECFTTHALHEGVRRITQLLEVIQDYIGESGTYRENRDAFRTKLALILHAYQCLAYCLYPVTPTLAFHMMDCLGVDRDPWHAFRHTVRVTESGRVNIAAIVDAICSMKRKVQH
ncbi:class I tRNA ligase family protein [Paraburkholderia azotifigens]|uniref:class I tRNA ligase family protein n=1 Tax=Paraburkholderia azotifigens TaxID=2057004 RepID=UPI0031803846